MDYQKLINNGIKRLRDKKGLTQEQFVEKINLSTKGLSNLERNRYQPNPDTINKICEAFDIHPCELLMDYPEKLGSKDLLKQITVLLKTFDENELQKIYKVLLALKD